MSLSVRDGHFDLVVLAGPGTLEWASIGARTLSILCSSAGLKVGLFGGPSLLGRGVVPLPGTGGVAFIEDPQRRIHRIRARAVVRVSPEPRFPAPFKGWHSEGLLPLDAAEALFRSERLSWKPATAILGTGNAALRFGSLLIERGVHDVLCVEPRASWDGKRFAGWEVERRRFEILGGKIVEAKPIGLTRKSVLLWQLRLEDSLGIRIVEVARVVSAGPFDDDPPVREHPPGSLLFELSQSARQVVQDDPEGWAREEESARGLAAKIIRALVADLGERKEWHERLLRASRSRQRRLKHHLEFPFTPAYSGKWLESADMKRVRDFPGVPRSLHRLKPVASLECFEDISCRACEVACPETAIRIERDAGKTEQFLIESRCTGCGACLRACPSQAAYLIHERESEPTSRLTLPWNGRERFQPGGQAQLVNRRGESLGSARVSAVDGLLVQLEVPTHLVWEARGISHPARPFVEDPLLQSSLEASQDEWVEISIEGERRLAREGDQLAVALFDMGYGRATDALFCPDATCRLCDVLVDGVKKPSCQTRVRKGMAVRRGTPPRFSEQALCACLGVTEQEVLDRLKKGRIRSLDALVEVTRVGMGKCRGRFCVDPLRRLLRANHPELSDALQWIDWRFPWSEWTLSPLAKD